MNIKIEKATNSDISRALHNAVNSLRYKDNNGENYYPWLTDFDDEYAFVRMDSLTFRIKYTLESSGKIIVDENSLEEVVMETTYNVVKNTEVVKQKDEVSLIDKIVHTIEKCLGRSNKETPIIKQFEDEQMIAIEPLYILPDEVDGHGDTMTETELRKMVDNLNKNIQSKNVKANLFHSKNTDKFELIKCWINEQECMIGDTVVPEGLPIMKIQFHDKKLWELRKSGKLTGLSIGARAKSVEEVDE